MSCFQLCHNLLCPPTFLCPRSLHPLQQLANWHSIKALDCFESAAKHIVTNRQVPSDDAEAPIFSTIARRSAALGLRLTADTSNTSPTPEAPRGGLEEQQGRYHSPLLLFRSYRCAAPLEIC